MHSHVDLIVGAVDNGSRPRGDRGSVGYGVVSDGVFGDGGNLRDG